jgi:hypothetical protein
MLPVEDYPSLDFENCSPRSVGYADDVKGILQMAAHTSILENNYVADRRGVANNSVGFASMDPAETRLCDAILKVMTANAEKLIGGNSSVANSVNSNLSFIRY